MSTTDTGNWLEQLGLGKYAELFSAQEIDVEIFRGLTEGDLEKLGVPLGDRKRLLAAAARVDVQASSDPHLAPVAAPAAPERRQLTVLFCDIVGSSDLAERLDPEDLHEVIRAYHRCVGDVVARFDGYVAQYLGDGTLAYFGHPCAHEDDAERAIHAGLSLVQAVGELTTRDQAPLRVRVGIATGLVVVSDLIGEAGRGGSAIGETPNLAARLQALASAGCVVIGESTRRLVAGLFELIDLTPQVLKGFSEPIRAWLVLGPSAAESRFEARQAAGLTPLVGREHELALLLERWQLAKDGEGQVVLLSGQPGIGKSRILQALQERLSGETYTALSHYCSPYHTNTALYPVTALLERAARLTHSEPPEQQLHKLEALLGLAVNDVWDLLPLVADRLAIPASGERSTAHLSPQLRKERTLAALIDQLVGLAGKQPVLALYEDVHWIDPTSLELLDLVVERVRSLPVLVVITFRPEFVAPWSGYPHVTSLSLSRLGRRHITEMIARITVGRELPVEVLDQVLAKTDGVPLFVEELTKSVLESGLLKNVSEGGGTVCRLVPLPIPASLHDSLMARLDRLAPIKEVAQIGAAIGRDFSYQLLAAIADRPEQHLRAALKQLVSSGLVFRRGTPPDEIYSFKHALVQDAAYQSLLKSRRHQLHARLAQVLRQALPHMAEACPELVAHHYTEAGLIGEAIDHWEQAGLLAYEHSTYTEAAAHLGRALGLLHLLPDSAERDRRELDLLTRLGSAYIASRGHGVPEVEEVYSRAQELCERISDDTRLSYVLQGRRLFYMMRADLGRAGQAADALIELGERRETVEYSIEGYRARGIVSFYHGDLVQARADLERAIALYNLNGHHLHARRYQADPAEACLSYSARSLWFLGYPEQAQRRSGEALAHAEALAHPFSLAEALVWRAELTLLLRQADASRESAQTARVFAMEHGFPVFAAMAEVMEGWSRLIAGEFDGARDRIVSGIERYQRTGSELFLPRFFGLLAEALGAAGQLDQGLETVADALNRSELKGERWCQAELHLTYGDLLLRLGPGTAKLAEGHFSEGLRIAGGQQAKSMELRAAASLARLWAAQDRHPEAHACLAGVLGWFKEGSDTFDLSDAAALLRQLGQLGLHSASS